MFNQDISNSEINIGFLIIGEKYCLHVWIRYNNKKYDNGFEQFMRNYDVAKYLPPLQYSIEKPNHLENFDDNYEEFYSQLQKFDTKTNYNNAAHNVKNESKLLKENIQKSTIVSVINLEVTMFDQIYSNLSNINIHYYLKLRIPIMHRQFFTEKSQNKEYIPFILLVNGINIIFHNVDIVY